MVGAVRTLSSAAVREFGAAVLKELPEAEFMTMVSLPPDGRPQDMGAICSEHVLEMSATQKKKRPQLPISSI